MGDHWKSLANKLGAPGMDAPVPPEPAPPARTPAPEPPPSRPAATAPTRKPVEPAPSPPAPAPAPVAPVESKPSVADASPKSKRKSSWDTLTSFFGIASTPEQPAAPEVSSAAPAETDDLGSFLGEPASRTESGKHGHKPTALDSLFGDAPRQELSWEKPAPRRIVDDVSGWDDDDVPARSVEPIAEAMDTDDPVAAESDAVEPEVRSRRRRRRRRGSRRDGGADDAREGAAPVRGRVHDDVDDDAIVDDVPAWSDPELVDAVEPGDEWSEPDSFESPAADLDAEPEVMPERRSNRRRRRGRGRGERTTEETATGETVREARPAREPRPVREPREPREGRETREPREAIEESVSSERPRRERPTREPREPREGQSPRSRGPRPVSDAPKRELSVVGADDVDDEVDSSLAAELEGETGGNRHPKIPTWADSLEAIIAANMENHRRIDSQRGGQSRGGGRPRGGPNGGSSGGGAGGRR